MTRSQRTIAWFTFILAALAPNGAVHANVDVALQSVPDPSQIEDPPGAQPFPPCTQDLDCAPGQICFPDTSPLREQGVCDEPDCRDTTPSSCGGVLYFEDGAGGGAPLRGVYTAISVTNVGGTDYADVWVQLSDLGSSPLGTPCAGDPECGAEEFCNLDGLCEPYLRVAELANDNSGATTWGEQTSLYRIGRLTPGETKVSYHYLEVPGADTDSGGAPVDALVSVYHHRPDIGILIPANQDPSYPICPGGPAGPEACRTPTDEVRIPFITDEALEATANEVRLVVSLRGEAVMGTLVDVTVVGQSGETGNTADFDRDLIQEGLISLTAAASADFPASDYRLEAVRLRNSGESPCMTSGDCAGILPLEYQTTQGSFDDPAELPPFCEDQIVDPFVACAVEEDCLPWQDCSIGDPGTPPPGTCWVDPITEPQCLTQTAEDGLTAFADFPYDYIITYTYSLHKATDEGTCFGTGNCVDGPGQICHDPSMPTPSACTDDGDCGAGGDCIGGLCAPACDPGGECPGGGTCVGNACVGLCVTPVTPVQYISSGQQVKHEDIDIPIGELPGIPAPTNPLTLEKSVTSGTVLPASGGIASYSVTLANSSSSDVQVDEIRDDLPVFPDIATIVPGSAAFDGVPLEPADDNPFQPPGTNTLLFTGPFVVAGGTTGELTYDVDLPPTPGWYENSAQALIGNQQIDGTLDPDDDASATTHVLVGPNTAPSFTSIPVTDADEDEPYSYEITADDPDAGDVPTLEPSVSPPWIAFTANGDGTGSLTGTPGAAEVGDHDVTLRVTDLAGEFAEQSFTITVHAAEACGNGLCEGQEAVSCPDDCVDGDGDGWSDTVDNCPAVRNIGQDDADDDAAGDACDCDPLNPNVWRTPGEVQGLIFEPDAMPGVVHIAFQPPLDPGGAEVTYDTLRTADPSDFELEAICLEPDGTDLLAFDSEDPPPGTIFAYLTRAVNACPFPLDEGPLGSAEGPPRSGRTCP